MLKPARVLQHHYNALTQKWSKLQSEIQIEEAPFAEGAFRAAYASLMPWEGNPSCSFVCKFAKDPSTPKSMYFNDVEAHEIATLYARKFNEHLPEAFPRIGYVPAFIVEFVDRPGRPVCGCEQRLTGKFKKYNNNVGAVCAMTPEEQAEMQRTSTLQNWDPTSTAQAFSHFSYEHSSCQVLICDIQGVENRFTDPQIHTMSGKGFGLGNLGQTGIRAFLLRHTCTDLCRAVGLLPIKAKDLHEKQVQASFTQERHAPPGSLTGGGSSSASAASSSQPMGKRPQQQQQHQSYDGRSSSNHNGHERGSSDVLVIDEPSSASSSSSSGAGQQQRSMRSSASTAFISHQASQAVMRPNQPQQLQAQVHHHLTAQAHQSRDRQQRPPQHSGSHSLTQPPAFTHQNSSSSSTAAASSSRQGSANPSPAHSPSPSASPRAPAPGAGSMKSSPPSAAAVAPPPKKDACLDDSDEALMASIMGD